MKRILVVAHAPSDNTRRMLEALLRGAAHPDVEGVTVRHVPPLEAGPEDVRGADAVVLLTPENLGSMSGAMKDFFDRSYYPLLEHTEGLPYALVIRGRHDGTGTRRGIQSIVNGLKWKEVEQPLMAIGELEDAHLEASEELGAKMAFGLEAGIF
jgi:multimeric flavodoxin WrbA